MCDSSAIYLAEGGKQKGSKQSNFQEKERRGGSLLTVGGGKNEAGVRLFNEDAHPILKSKNRAVHTKLSGGGRVRGEGLLKRAKKEPRDQRGNLWNRGWGG